jgi:hypothetical protein
MYGVPANLDLKFLHGAELTLVGLGLYQINLHFHPEGIISVQGDWELRDETDSLIDRDSWGPGREPYQLHKLLGRSVTVTEVAAPESFALRFDSGHVLRVFDNSPEYESFSIQPGNIFV